jgi:2-dehydropantoate 2-reductase
VPIRILVLGTGAMASLFGARLARAGRAAVTLAGSWYAALREVPASGITVFGDGPPWSVPVGIRALREDLGPADVVLVLVKSNHTADVAPRAVRALTPGGLVLTLQNGLGNAECLAEVVGERDVAQGVTGVGATLLSAGRVAFGGAGPTFLGATDATRDRLALVADLLNGAGFETDLRDDIAPAVWRKLAVNCAVNPLSALLGVPNGRLLSIPAARAVMSAAAREVEAVARARGIDLGADPAALAVAVAERTATNRSSMLQDFERDAPTEIDAINGAVVDEGRRLGIATPVNAALWWRVSEGLRIGEDTAGHQLDAILRGDGLPEALRLPVSPDLFTVPGSSPSGAASATPATSPESSTAFPFPYRQTLTDR